MTDLISRPFVGDAPVEMSSMPDSDPDTVDLAYLLGMIAILLLWTGVVALWVAR